MPGWQPRLLPRTMRGSRRHAIPAGTEPADCASPHLVRINAADAAWIRPALSAGWTGVVLFQRGLTPA